MGSMTTTIDENKYILTVVIKQFIMIIITAIATRIVVIMLDVANTNDGIKN